MTSLLGGLASVEVEVDEDGEQARGGQQQQHLQQTILHYVVTTSLSRFLFKSKPGGRGWQQLEEEGKEEECPE